jgi:hypothetical protein
LRSKLLKRSPGAKTPRYLIRDRDAIYGAARDKPIAAGSPWQNSFAERLIGSIRRECVDHVIALSEQHGTGGVVLSGGAVLGPREVEAMRGVPELAFINCCYLGRIDPSSKTKASALGKERPRFAGRGLDQQRGALCGGGWAVDDAPAKLFAKEAWPSDGEP